MTKEERMNNARQLKRRYNCCQAVVLSWADKLPIDEQTATNLAAPFGAGLAGCREVCGCVSGMAMVCGLTGHAGETRALIEKFRESNGDIVCGRLLKMGKKPCPEMVAEASGLLTEILQES